ncbi:MAG: beta-ketoacyl-ACP synthase II [Gammaproteobacteria bacterium]
MTKRRVVITGVGMVTPLGLDTESTWKAILDGKSGIGPLTAFDTSQFPVQICASVKNFDPSPYLDPKESRKADMFMQYAVAAAHQAMTDSKLSINAENAARIGVAIGSGMGGLPLVEKNHDLCVQKGAKWISPTFIPNAIINMAAGMVSIKHGLKGPNISVVTACGTGAHNIACAARMIAYGDADAMLSGGSEMSMTMLGVGGFASARALSTRNDDPEHASRPWDKDRDGFIVGEGAGVVMLEEYEHAKKRGAHIYAELIGVGMSSDAHHMTAPEPEGEGAALAMHNALADSQLAKEKVDYINAHGTSTGLGDIVEVKAIKKVFGEHAYKLAVSSTKSMTGHLLGAAGSVEAIFSILALRDQIAPPTMNLENPDEGCDLDFVPNKARPMRIDYVLSNSFGFGGTNVSLLFRKIMNYE